MSSAFICPSCQSVYENDGKCKKCGAILVPLEFYLKEYESKIEEELNAIQNILDDLNHNIKQNSAGLKT